MRFLTICIELASHVWMLDVSANLLYLVFPI